MAGSRKSKTSRPATADIAARLTATLRAIVVPGDRLLVGFSGGVDSMVLLDLLDRARGRSGFHLAAMHVNHQLSPHAGKWEAFCRKICRERDIPFRSRKVRVAHGNSTEAAAREARYAALLCGSAEHVVLAHNRDDQAETVLLNLLRGAGVRGLAAMPLARRMPSRAARGGTASVLRPLLDTPRAEIERYARRHRLAWVEDDSNRDSRYLRNFLRNEIVPGIAARIPACRETLARAARHQAEAAALLDELAAMDGAAADALPVASLRQVPRARAKNLLLSFLSRHGVDVPGAERLEEALRQAMLAKDDARVVVAFGPHELRRFSGLLHVVPRIALQTTPWRAAWQGESTLALPGLGGVLTMRRARGAGLSLDRIATGAVTIRPRSGGERMRPDAGRPTRSVRNLLQEARVPPWHRERLPFIYCGERLVCVPGIGIDEAFQARAGERAVVPEWKPK